MLYRLRAHPQARRFWLLLRRQKSLAEFFDFLERLIKTFTFRLALVYVGLFGLSVIILFTFIYIFATRYVETQVSDSIRLRYNYLIKDYRDDGSSALEERINELIAGDADGTEIYLVVNRDSEKLAGNLNVWPFEAKQEGVFEKDGRWVRFHISGTTTNPKSIEVKAITIPLSKWRFLLVGQSLQNSERVEKTIVKTFWASLMLTLIMAFIGALIMTRSVIHRINVINRSAATIMHGNLSTRIPYATGGDEFDDLSINLNRMLDKIEMLMQSISHFANNIAHDLRSPLNRIITRLDAGMRTLDDANPARKLLENNIQDMHALVGTFNSILKISELETNAEFRHFTPCDLHAIIGNLVELYEPYATEKNVSLDNRITSALHVLGEPNLLTQAFANLIDNAIKFTPEGGHVTISGHVHHHRVEAVIADSGSGIPPEFRDKVFEKFFRLELSRHTAGNGLGLSLVAAIARIHNATITLEDNLPGLRVRISLPQAPQN